MPVVSALRLAINGLGVAPRCQGLSESDDGLPGHPRAGSHGGHRGASGPTGLRLCVFGLPLAAAGPTGTRGACARAVRGPGRLALTGAFRTRASVPHPRHSLLSEHAGRNRSRPLAMPRTASSHQTPAAGPTSEPSEPKKTSEPKFLSRLLSQKKSCFGYIPAGCSPTRVDAVVSSSGGLQQRPWPARDGIRVP